MKNTMKTMIVIPARLASSRLPKKMLLTETGLPLIQHTYQQAQKSELADRVLVATDHQSIFDTVKGFGGEVVMTDPNAPSGSDRVAEVSQQFADYELFCNVQGDEPEIEPEVIDTAIQLLKDQLTTGNRQPVMSTLCSPITQKAELNNPNCVKVVANKLGQALYFSRAPIPFAREEPSAIDDSTSNSSQRRILGYQHIGIYVYHRDFLEKWITLPACETEQIEKLEQLRVLDAGYEIAVGQVSESKPGIDTPEDYRAFVSRWENC